MSQVFAVHAVGGIDLEFETIFFPEQVRKQPRRGQKYWQGLPVLDGAAVGADVEIVHDQVARLTSSS